jgi:hypothetical protein
MKFAWSCLMIFLIISTFHFTLDLQIAGGAGHSAVNCIMIKRFRPLLLNHEG